MIVQIEVTEENVQEIEDMLLGMYAATEALEEHEAEGHEELNEDIDNGCEWLKKLLPKK
jgi:hypothetical protein